MTRQATVLIVVIAAGCGGGGGDDGEPADRGDASAEVDGSPGTASATLECSVGDVDIPVAKRCTMDADCGVAYHMVNCCGTLSAIGIAETGRDEFAAAEAQCRASYPDCGCASLPTTAEDGRIVEGIDVSVRCDPELGCQSYVDRAPVK